MTDNAAPTPVGFAPRRGFTVVVIPLLLVISLVVMGFMLAGKAPAGGTTSAAYNTGKQWGPAIGGILFGLFMLALASRIAENRDHKAATLIIGGILLLANFAFLMNVLGLAKPLPAKPRGGNLAKLLSGGEPPAEPASPAAPRSAPPAIRESQPSAGTPPITNAPTQPPSTPRPRPAPSPTPTATLRPAPSPPRPEPASPDFAEVAAYLSTDLPAAKDPLGALAKELGDLTAELSMKAATFASDAVAVPKHDRPALKKRREEAQVIKALAQAAHKRLSGALDDAQARLKAVGVDEHEVLGLAIRFSNMTKSSTRAFGAADYERFADDVIEEATMLEKSFAKWKLDRKGEITSKDFKTRADAGGARMRVESFKHRMDRTAEQLGGQ